MRSVAVNEGGGRYMEWSAECGVRTRCFPLSQSQSVSQSVRPPPSFIPRGACVVCVCMAESAPAAGYTRPLARSPRRSIFLPPSLPHSSNCHRCQRRLASPSPLPSPPSCSLSNVLYSPLVGGGAAAASLTAAAPHRAAPGRPYPLCNRRGVASLIAVNFGRERPLLHFESVFA